MTRVWDRFLTEQDKAHIAQSGQHHEQPRKIFGLRPAVINIDLYRAVFGENNMPLLEGLKQWPYYCGPAAWAAAPHIQRVMRTARDVEVPIVHLRSPGLQDDDSAPSWWKHYRGPANNSAQTRYFDIIDEFAPLPGELVIRKVGASGFFGTPLMAQLIEFRIDTLLITGESTSGCVRATVVDGSDYRFNVLVIEECVFDRHEASHAINLFDMDRKYATVISVDRAVEYLNGVARADTA